MHLLFSAPGRLNFYLTSVYSVPIPLLKERLWQDVLLLLVPPSDPWVVIGDFIEILSVDERSGGACVNYFGICLFQDRMLACGLTDMGYRGPKFTWRNPKSGSNPQLFERLDCAIGNTNFLFEFSNCYV